MPYTNAKLLINAYARKAGDAARMKLYHLPKTKVHLPPKEIPSSLKVAGQRLNGNLRYAVFVVAKKQKNFFKAFSYLVAVDGWITKSASLPNPFRLLIRSCLSTASTILRFPIFVSEVFCSACRPDFGKIRHMTRPGVSERQSGGKLSSYKPTAAYGWTTGLC